MQLLWEYEGTTQSGNDSTRIWRNNLFTVEGGKLAALTIELDFTKCDCCGLMLECTLAYIETIRERYQGKWICGLCAEAVKDEMMRCERLINAEEALTRHLNFCKKFSSSTPPPDPTIHLIAAMRQLLRRILESPKSLRLMPCSPTRNYIWRPCSSIWGKEF